ncbi:MAG: hypothetical protein Fur0018_27300 [Anaerolineales bacterium]
MMYRLLDIPEENLDLLRSTARNLVHTLAALYVLFHMVATLWWPHDFTPSLWAVTFGMMAVVAATLWLLPRAYLLSQAVWMGGLAALTWLAFRLYAAPEILLLWILLPLMGPFTLGMRGALGTTGTLWALTWLIGGWLSPGYAATLRVGGLCSVALGWGLSSNLLSALDSASYHYHQARKLLEETRQHRANISRMLKEQHQANYQLERLNQMLASARRHADEARSERDRFILAVSHELRSPLNFILGFSDLMVKSPETYAPLDVWPSGLYDDVQEIYRSSKHLLGLINDILDLGKIDAQRMTIYREQGRIEEVIAEVCAMTRELMERKGLWLHTEIAPGLPEVLMDRTRIRQVLLNLVTNALRFTEQGGVTIAASLEGDHLQVSVADTGSGIPPEDLPKVFDEFRQAGQSNWQRREGTGLGLAISRRFIALHGGRMSVESVAGEGTRFWFTLPLSLVDLPPEDLPARPLPYRQGVPVVVLLSHDPAAQQLVRACLDGYEVLPLPEASDLPDVMRRVYPRAVLMDAGFPAAALPPDLPYDAPLVRFALPGVQADEAALPENVTTYLVKPILPADLLAAVRALGEDVRHLLVVDDDPAMLRFVTQTLRSDERPWVLRTAGDGAGALAMLDEARPDALLLDLELPDMDGHALLARLNARQTVLPVVIISAVERSTTGRGGRDVALDVQLQRTLSKDELRATLRSVLDAIPPHYPLDSASRE